jgi:uncharacterized membrane protein YdbT with pleckstrin-like domain
MGRYIDEILQPDEKVLYSTNAHWIFYLPGLTAGTMALVFLLLARYVSNANVVLICLSVAAIAAAFGLVSILKAWFHRWTTETDVTNLRVIHKAGFITRRTFEMNLDKIESVDVFQGVLGRLLNYGNVVIRGVGDGRETIRTIAAPLAFRNSITAR